MMYRVRKTISYIHRNKKQWITFTLFSVILFYLVYVILFKGTSIDPESALSLLSTLAQSEAAILAIVISLSLVVIEFSASKYSARVIDFVKNDPILWGFLLAYGLSMFYSLYLIVLTKKEHFDLEFYCSTAFTFSIIAYALLLCYILYVFKIMRPTSIIDILLEKVDRQSLSDSWYYLGGLRDETVHAEPRINRIHAHLNDEKDPLLPVIDIICASIESNDYTTAKYGLNAIVTKFFISDFKQNPLHEKRISEHLLNRIFEIWRLVWKKRDAIYIGMVSFFYYNIGLQSFVLSTIRPNPSEKLKNSLCKWKKKILTSIYDTFGVYGIEKKNTQNNSLYTIFLSVHYQKTVFKSVIYEKNFYKESMDAIGCLTHIVSLTFHIYDNLDTNEKIEVLESSITELSDILGEVGIDAINADSKDALDKIISALNDIGKASIDNNLIHSIFHILENLNTIGEESAKKGEEFELLTKQIVESLENLASKINSHSQELTGETRDQVIEYHEYIKENYDYEKAKYAFEELNDGVELIIRAYISSHVYTIGRESIRNNLLDATQQCLKSLEIIERILKNGTNSRHIGEDIRDLGLEAVKKEQTYPLMEYIVKSLYSIGMLQFGYMFDWNRDLEKRQEFLKKECNDCLTGGLQSSYSEFENTVKFKDSMDFYDAVYFEDKLYRERTLIINDKERKDIKCIFLINIEDGYHEHNTLKLFKSGVYKNSEKAYYKIPELLEELADPILEYALNSPSDKTIKPFTMIIKSFENFGILSIYFRDKFSLIERIRSLMNIEDSFTDIKYSKYKNDQRAGEYLNWAATVISDSLYKLAIECLNYNLVDSGILHQSMRCLTRIQKEYPSSLYDAVYKFEKISEMIKESELTESERDNIIETIESAIEELKEQKSG